MNRLRLEPGTHGQVSVTYLGPGVWKARARYRDRLGEAHSASAIGLTKAEARRLLLERLHRLRGRKTQDVLRDLPEPTEPGGMS